MHADLAPDSWLENHQLQRIQESLFYIESSLDQPLSVNQLARKVHWSRWQFQRIFQRETGTSVASYVRVLRLSHAAKLLLTTANRQIDIALECGFDSEISFNKSFRKLYHCTPGNYRKRGQYSDLKQPLALSRPDKIMPQIEPKLLQIKIETQCATRLYGVMGKFNGIFSKSENFEEEIPKIWDKFKTITGIDNSNHNIDPIGIIDLTEPDPSHTNIPYWACIQTQDSLLQQKLDYIDIPEQHYAVLPHIGPGREMVKTLQWFILEWLPNSSYTGMYGYDLERFSRNFNPLTEDAYMEYWVPVIPK